MEFNNAADLALTLHGGGLISFGLGLTAIVMVFLMLKRPGRRP